MTNLPMTNLPNIRETYNCFDDGKVTASRLYQIEIEEIIEFKDSSQDIKSLWKEELQQCNWLYNSRTTHFIVGRNLTYDSKEIFAETKDGGWFGLKGKYQIIGRLDLDGSLTKSMNDRISALNTPTTQKENQTLTGENS